MAGTIMKKPNLAQIRQAVESAGGTYRKLKIYLHGNDDYEINGVTMTKAEMMERYKMGEL